MTPWRRRPIGPLRCALALAPGLALLQSPALPQGRSQPPPPASTPIRYDPDASTCQPQLIRSGFERQLQPYADQSPAVLERLRQVQLEITAATLRRCQARGLLTRQQARRLEAELLGPGGAQPLPSTRP